MAKIVNEQSSVRLNLARELDRARFLAFRWSMSTSLLGRPKGKSRFKLKRKRRKRKKAKMEKRADRAIISLLRENSRKNFSFFGQRFSFGGLALL
jgi:hypothetical protein